MATNNSQIYTVYQNARIGCKILKIWDTVSELVKASNEIHKLIKVCRSFTSQLIFLAWLDLLYSTHFKLVIYQVF